MKVRGKRGILLQTDTDQAIGKTALSTMWMGIFSHLKLLWDSEKTVRGINS
jgi:hypothetical protein